ncbi:MAG: cysteine desulfurase NifS [Candidatus Eremiobacter antarcticus]|nr:cysteine desulfurase [Candidatus Eremiobacteraeota bacterium]MBC5808265.1 cysteine desulfurase [Candidatus Eremiobacteraeota bacterium]PZR63647.1 MAG: cysteine desulfurase NifS [Candidatus Eremiobacter sp. RRmetagenome_bin22]
MERIYFDNAATTAVRPEVIEAMLPFYDRLYANPSSLHSGGQRVQRALHEARARTAAALGAMPEEIVFTGGGSEADNLAIFGTMARARQRNEFLTSAIEHHAVLHAAERLRRGGFVVKMLPVDREGLVDPDALRQALSSRTALVSIMHGNNEIGTLQSISELAAIVHEHGALLHTDAVQTVGHLDVDVRRLDVDMLSLSAHKFEGPKGVGALFMRSGVKLEPLLVGGGQEDGRRAGTENVPGIIGLARALELAIAELDATRPRLQALRDEIIERMTAVIPRTHVNGSRSSRLPHNINVRFDGIEGDTVVIGLDVAGIEISTGSACTSGSLDPSHVMTALGLTAAQARGAVRISLGRNSTREHARRLIAVLEPLIARLRDLSASLVAQPNGRGSAASA